MCALKVSFDVEIEVKECPKNSPGYSRKFDIKPVGLADKLEVQMELVCKCDCESEDIAVSFFYHKSDNHVCFERFRFLQSTLLILMTF